MQHLFISDVHRYVRNDNEYKLLLLLSLLCGYGAVTIVAAVATRSRARTHSMSMEDRHRKSLINLFLQPEHSNVSLTKIASPIVADFQYVVYSSQIINVTDILLQLFWGKIVYSLDYKSNLHYMLCKYFLC